MTETRGRITKEAKVADKAERRASATVFAVVVKVAEDCPHTMTETSKSDKHTCTCCKRAVPVCQFGTKSGRAECVDCDSGTFAPVRPVDFRKEVEMVDSVGVCIFCSAPAIMVFIDTREPICSRCVKGER